MHDRFICAFAVFVLLIVVAPAARATAPDGPAFLVKDIATATAPSNSPFRSLSSVLNLTAVGDHFFFTSADHRAGIELWRSDGTTAGTALVKDINPGPDGSTSYSHEMLNIQGTLFFVADDGSSGYELWKSDGTEAGTTLVKDIQPGPGGSYPQNLANVAGTLFFVADDGVHGGELWKSDGTEAGTTLVKDICQNCNWWVKPSSLVDVDGTLFFMADDGAHG